MANSVRCCIACRAPHPPKKRFGGATLRATRAFSNGLKLCRNGAIPAFRPSQSQALSDLLETVRSKVFLPAYLSESQRKLVYQSRNHGMLRNDPFYIELGSGNAMERVLLEPIDQTKDVPNSWQSVRSALLLMSGDRPGASHPGSQASAHMSGAAENTLEKRGRGNLGDWANLLPLLEGMRAAGRRWKPWQWEQIVRIAGNSGACSALLDAARQMDRTGFYLIHTRTVREVFWACRMKAINGGWSLEATTKALSHALQFSDLLDDPRQRQEAQHATNRGDLSGAYTHSNQPDIIGVVLELASIKAASLAAKGASETATRACKADVKIHITRLLPNINTLDVEPIANKHLPAAAAADYELLRWSPLLSGLHAAERLLGPELPDQQTFNDAIRQIERLVADSRKVVTDNVGGDEGARRLGLLWSQSFPAP